MKEIHVSQIADTVERLCIEACTVLSEDWWQAMDKAIAKEESPLGREILELLKENARLAASTSEAICQDTGIAVVFLEIGQDVHITGGSLYEAINEGVRKGYTRGYLRKSVVKDPLIRQNTGDNTPAIIHTEIVPGSNLKITVAPKGIGSENTSALKMLKPADGKEGIIRYVLEVVEQAGPNPCPPIIVGIGLGGNFEKAALLAKKALLRPLGERHPAPHISELEEELLKRINATGIGPQGLGGRITALDVHIETYPTHIGGLPVAVNIQCHAARHAEAIL
ncbi:fumarase, class I alpha subunit [Thermanaeromonas toyohensis ToBE]|uniref:Fumarase, class I alpha subunit n=1 Tax=Thermanaeromonas toyohensis ToBE TaxID=698762 RepID=A0A1W1VW17_9FIRM|nr:fumarate hydratase [Thermanaeromonas toyohensis]SMB97567.1 fumarase, class I alpha subunit [Thermanaeromonas toyohensis ToBE]